MRNRLFVLIALIAVAFLLSCAERGNLEAADIIACGTFNPETSICDKRDGNLYKIKRMPDSKYWMTENLNYKPPHGLSKCYEEKEENCRIYGRLYSWSMREELCPDGWRVPSDEEWDNLELYSGGKNSGQKLKTVHSWLPYGDNIGNGDDFYGFSALPAGAYMIGHLEDGETCEKYDEWGGLGEITIFISTGENFARAIVNNAAGEIRFCWAENSLKSVRCIKE